MKRLFIAVHDEELPTLSNFERVCALCIELEFMIDLNRCAFGRFHSCKRKCSSVHLDRFYCTFCHFYSSRRRCLGEPRMFFASCLVSSRLGTLSDVIAFEFVCVGICFCVCRSLCWHVGSSVSRVLCRLLKGHIVCVV